MYPMSSAISDRDLKIPKGIGRNMRNPCFPSILTETQKKKTGLFDINAYLGFLPVVADIDIYYVLLDPALNQ